MGNEMLGAVEGLDDPAIVKKATSLPLDRIAIVRVFPGGADGKPTRVVLVFYAPSGAVMGATSGEDGQALAMRQAQAEGAGLSRSVADAVRSVAEGQAPASDEARKEYEENYVSFEDWVAVGVYTGAVVNRWTQAYKGKYKVPLRGPEFYEHIGQVEHAKAFRRKVGIKWLGGSERRPSAVRPRRSCCRVPAPSAHRSPTRRPTRRSRSRRRRRARIGRSGVESIRSSHRLQGDLRTNTTPRSRRSGIEVKEAAHEPRTSTVKKRRGVVATRAVVRRARRPRTCTRHAF